MTTLEDLVQRAASDVELYGSCLIDEAHAALNVSETLLAALQRLRKDPGDAAAAAQAQTHFAQACRVRENLLKIMLGLSLTAQRLARQVVLERTEGAPPPG